MPDPRKFYFGVDSVNQRLVRVGDATQATDAVTLQQLQAYVRGLRWKEPVRAAATSNVNLATPGASFDGVVLAANDRVLLPVQSAGSQNGIYVWSGANAPLVRAADADEARELIGASTLVLEGTVNADRQFNQTVDTITLGTTALTFVEFGGATIYTPGNGLTVAGRQFSVVPQAGILSTPAGVGVDFSIVGRKFATTITSPIGAGGSVDVTHTLSSLDFTYSTRDASTGEMFELDVRPKDANTATVASAVAFGANTVRLTLIG